VRPSLNHPNIAAIHDLEEIGGTRYLVLELVEGETLADKLMRGPIPLDEAVHVAKQIVDALEAAHERGIVHRDLKPGNIKIGPDGKVKVLDFGLAKVASPLPAAEGFSNSPTLMSGSMGGVILGTAPYMSPEQARGKQVDARTDIWAVGCVLYEMLTGQQTFTGETTTDVLAKVLEAQPKWEALPAETPSSIRFLLETALNKDPKQRLHHIADAKLLLNQPATLDKSTDVRVRARGGRWAWFAAALSLLAASVLAVLYFMRTPAERPVLRFSISAPEKAVFPNSPLTPFVSVSHDGRTIAFLAISDGIQRIWVRSLDSLDARLLAGTEGVAGTWPFFSPDDRFLGFFAAGRLKKIDIGGGPAQVICDATGLMGSWNQNGVIVFSLLGGGGPLYRVDADGGKAEPVTVLDASRHETGHGAPEFLPDGDHFLFTSGTAATSAIMAGSLRSKEINLVLNGESNFHYDSGHLLFVRDGTLLAQRFDVTKLRVTGDTVKVADQISGALGGYAFASSGNGTLIYRTRGNATNRQLQWFDRSGKLLSSVGPPGAYRNPELSPDGKRIAVEQTDPQTQNIDIWLIDVASGAANRWKFDPGFNLFPVWSPTGDQIAFGTPRNGGNIYVKGSNGGAEELLIKEALYPQAWSRDNRFLLYNVQALSRFMVLPLFGDRKPFLYLPNFAAYGHAQISPDGKWLAFFSNESGELEVYVRNFPVPSEKYQISTDGGSAPRWRGDGKELFYLSHQKLVAVPLRTTDQSVEVLAPSVLFGIGAGLGAYTFGSRHQYDVTADGQRFLVNSPIDSPIDQKADADRPMTLLSNWLASIKH
jgi:Tol biopolymer transport system component